MCLHRILYWTDWSTNGSGIYRSLVVNPDRQTLVGDNLTWPNALAIDFTGNQSRDFYVFSSKSYWVTIYFCLLPLFVMHNYSQLIVFFELTFNIFLQMSWTDSSVRLRHSPRLCCIGWHSRRNILKFFSLNPYLTHLKKALFIHNI